MSIFTYEFEDRASCLETYEWDNTWWERTELANVPRVLYIGDSISCGVLRRANKLANGSILFDGFGSSKAVDNPYLLPAVSLALAQQKKRCAVLFNSGLHGWHLDDETEYPRCYAEVIDRLQGEVPDVPLVLVFSTSVADAARDARVRARNEAVLRIAKERGLGVIDLYTPSLAVMRKEDGVHYTDESYAVLAERILFGVRALCEEC